jgi:hypothetical protein
MKNFRDELRLITNNTEWTDNEKFEAIDELHERYSIQPCPNDDCSVETILIYQTL